MARHAVFALAVVTFLGLGTSDARADHRGDRWDAGHIGHRYDVGVGVWSPRHHYDSYYYRRPPLPPRVIVPFPGHPAVVLPPARVYGYPSYYGPGYPYHHPHSGTSFRFSFGW